MRARDNPYRVERLDALEYRLQGMTWSELWGRLRELDGRGCVVGPHGSGKTALLSGLTAYLGRRGVSVYNYVIRADGPRPDLARILASLAHGRIAILDGADLLSASEWGRIRSADGGSLIVSSHGKRMLPILYRCRPTATLLGELMTELHPGNGCEQPTPARLFDRHTGNLREALLELYDFHAQLGSAKCIR